MFYALSAVRHNKEGILKINIMDYSHMCFLILLMAPVVRSAIMLERGDIEIDVILAVTEPLDEFTCDENDISVSAVEIAQTFAYVINEVNTNSQILPNVTMGFAVYDTCEKEEWTRLVTEGILENKEIKSGLKYSPILMYPSYLPLVETVKSTVKGRNGFDVELDFWGSSLNQPSKPDDSAHKSSRHFTYVSPQILVAKPIKDVLAYYNWTYVSLVTSEMASTFMATEALQKELRSAGICIASTVNIPPGTTNPEVFEMTLHDLSRYARARVVLLFLNEKDMAGLAKAVDNNPSYSGNFVWVTFGHAASLLSKNGVVIKLSKGYEDDTPQFIKYYTSLTLENNVNNPWFGKALDFYNECTLKARLFGLDCEVHDHLVNTENRPLDVYYATVHEAVMNYVYALDKSMENVCINASTKDTTSGMSKCQMSLNETMLLNKMVEIYQNTYAKFSIEQVFANGTTLRFGTWNRQLEVTQEPHWATLQSLSGDRLTYAPLSVCSSPCPHDQKPVYGTDKCCWVCVKV